MSQHDYNIANATFPNVRTDLNNALGAIATNNSGDSAPSTTYANQFWYETDTNKLYIRNEDNDAWIHILTLNQTNDTVASVEGASTFAGIDDQSSSNDDQITITDSAVIINEDSDDLDTRIESNGNANMLFVDGGNDHINIGTATDLGGVLNVAGTAVIQTADNSDTLSLISTDADATSGPNLRLFRNSSSPADGDDIGKIIFSAENDASEEIDYITVRGDLTDVTDGTEDGVLKIAGLIGGAVKEFARFGDGVGVVFNEESNAANDFRIESDALSHAFFLDGGTDHISIGNSSTSLYTLDIKQNSDFTGSSSDTANEAPLRVWSTHSNGRGAIAIGGNNNNGIFNKGTSDLVIQGYNAITFDCSQTNDDKFGTKTERMTISNNGKVYIGHSEFSATNTNLTLFPDGQIYFAMNSSSSTNVVRFYNTATGNIAGNINMNGDATSYNSGSDYRLKDNVNYSFDATTRLKQLKPARFNFINTPDTTVDGFLAHEAQTVVPESVTGVHNETETRNKVVVNSNGIIIADDIEEADWSAGKVANEDGNTKYPTNSTWEASKVVPVYQSIDHSKMVPLLVKTIQELEARITALES